MVRCGDPPEKGGTGRVRVDGLPCRIPLRLGKDGNLYCLTHDCNISERNRKVAFSASSDPLRREWLAIWGKKGFITVVQKYGIEQALGFIAEHKRQNPTSSEEWLYGILDEIGVSYEAQVVYPNCSTAYILDAAHLKGRHRWTIEIDDGWRLKERPFGRDGRIEYGHMVVKLDYLESRGVRTLWIDTSNTEPELNKQFIYDFLGENS